MLMRVTTMPTRFSFHEGKIETADTPAEYASRNVVVTVEKMTMSRPAAPSQAWTMMDAISLSCVSRAAPKPMMYIQQLAIP